MSTAARGKLLLSRYGLYAVIAAILLAAGAGFLAYQAYTAPAPTDTVSEQINVESYSVQSTERAEVTGPNATLYEQGTTLENMPVYFFRESPILELAIETNVPEDVGATVQKRLTLQYEATREGTTFYEETVLIEAGEFTPGDGTATMSGSLNMSQISNRMSELNNLVSAVGSLSVTAQLSVEYESDRYEGELTASTAVTTTGTAYWLAEDLEASTTRSETETTEITLEQDYGDAYLYGGMAVLFLLMGLGAGIVSYRGVDVERIQTELARAEFSEWISTGEIPTKAEKEYVKVESLEDVVDVAIDTNKRVIYDPNLEAYAVIDGDLVYYYTPGPDELREWLDV